jgi:hypothetical protein
MPALVHGDPHPRSRRKGRARELVALNGRTFNQAADPKIWVHFSNVVFADLCPE